MGINLHGPGPSGGFLAMTPNAQEIKEEPQGHKRAALI